jgi:hypothetical protein
MLTANTNKVLGNQADSVFRSNLLPVPSEFDYIKSPYEDFLEARGKLLSQYVGDNLLV